jgi:hypothetical protein
MATAVSATLAPLALFEELTSWRRIAGSLLVGFAYMVASYLIQGAFKETIEAMLVLAFAIGLHEASRRRLVGRSVDPRWARAVPLAVLAIGAVYAYSFPGLLWLAGAALIWALAELVVGLRRGDRDAVAGGARIALPTVVAAVALLVAASLPELGRMIDFADFETFDPAGPGLGNLFNPISPLEALGIWPSGDFRLDPGDGFAPAAAFWLGAALGAAILAYGLYWWLRRVELAVPSALAAAVVLYLYAHFAGTPYQEAKAIALASPLVALIGVRAVLEAVPPLASIRAAPEPRTVILAVAGAGFMLAAAGCSVLALANGPVGPATYSPALTELRPLRGSTLVLAPKDFLDDEHGRDYLVWELRGGRVCVAAADGNTNPPPPEGIARVITFGSFPAGPYGLDDGDPVGPYEVWPAQPPPAGAGPCPLISSRGRADPGSE